MNFSYDWYEIKNRIHEEINYFLIYLLNANNKYKDSRIAWMLHEFADKRDPKPSDIDWRRYNGRDLTIRKGWE